MAEIIMLIKRITGALEFYCQKLFEWTTMIISDKQVNK